MKEYKILREHHGDKVYVPGGENRKATPGAVAHLVSRGVLEEVDATDAELKPELPDPENKANVPPTSDNKSAPENKGQKPEAQQVTGASKDA